MDRAVLITGATGYIGHRIARRYLAEGRRVTLWLRAADDAELSVRSATLSAELADVAGDRLAFSWGDLREADPFSRVDADSIGSIIHSAAVTRFNVERDEAQAVNLDGSLKLFELARRCRHLERFGMLSTVYAAGLVGGEVGETELSRDREFANHYEWSKFETERALSERYADLPWSVFRIATVIADDDGGAVTQYNAVHNTLKLFFYGLLSLLPGDADTPLYLVTGEFCAEAVRHLMDRGDVHGHYHVCHSRDESVTLTQFTDIAFSRFEREDDFRARKILRPLLCDAESFELLAEGVDSFGGAVVNQGLRSVRPFVRQLYSPKSFRNERLVGALPAYRAPSPAELVDATVDVLVKTRWGKRALEAA